MTWRDTEVPSIRIIRPFRIIDNGGWLVAMADVKVGEHIRLHDVRLLATDGGHTDFIVATPPRLPGSRTVLAVELSPFLRAAIRDAMLQRYRERVTDAA